MVRGAAFQAAIASSVNQTVRLPRRRRVASYEAQFATPSLRPGNVVATSSVGLVRHEGDQDRDGPAAYDGGTIFATLNIPIIR